MNTDYDAIRQQIEQLCKLPVTFGAPAPEEGYTPRRSGPKSPQPVTLRYTVSVKVGDFSTAYTYPVSGQAYYGSAVHTNGVAMGNEWIGMPPRNKLPKIGDVLCCLLQDAQSGSETFDDFCRSFGYDTDSRKAFDIYLKCQQCLNAMQRAFGADLNKATELAYQL
jgi:hypothetical protein